MFAFSINISDTYVVSQVGNRLEFTFDVILARLYIYLLYISYDIFSTIASTSTSIQLEQARPMTCYVSNSFEVSASFHLQNETTTTTLSTSTEVVPDITTTLEISTEVEVTKVNATTDSNTTPDTPTQSTSEITALSLKETSTGSMIRKTTEYTALTQSTTHVPTEPITSSTPSIEPTYHSATSSEDTTTSSAKTTTEPIPHITTTTISPDVMTRTFCSNTTGNLSRKLITNLTQNHNLFSIRYTY